jgi:hypothetical protein
MSQTASLNGNCSNHCDVELRYVVAHFSPPQRPSSIPVLWHSSNAGLDRDDACCSRRHVVLRDPDGCLQCGPVPGGSTRRRVRTEVNVNCGSGGCGWVRGGRNVTCRCTGWEP